MADMVAVRVTAPYHDHQTGSDHYEIGECVRYSRARAEELEAAGVAVIEDEDDEPYEDDEETNA